MSRNAGPAFQLGDQVAYRSDLDASLIVGHAVASIDADVVIVAEQRLVADGKRGVKKRGGM